ncbi:MAG: P-loop NTPase [Deltaproteobacteria bacterium]|nr:P-loop NTPase [Deltaproteobacteria bacterium]
MKKNSDSCDCDSASCSNHETAGGQPVKQQDENEQMKARMSKIKHKIMVMSGKGGVGKSTVAANIAVAMAMEGKSVGLLDVDFHGPSIPKLLHLEGQLLTGSEDGMQPVDYVHGIKVMSLGFMLGNQDSAVIWRGPLKIGVIKQLLTDVSWGELDYLIIDFPPGTGDEPLSVAQFLPDADGAVIVTTPQDLSLSDVRKSIDFCRKLNMKIIGVIENMSGMVCPHCGNVVDVFKKGGGQTMAGEMGVPFLGRIPLDPRIVTASDDGVPFVYHFNETEAAKAFSEAVLPILMLEEQGGSVTVNPVNLKPKESDMKSIKIAIPVEGGRLCAHFGHCETFVLVDVDTETKKIIKKEELPPPPHEPGLLPHWLHEKGANMIIAGGMGSRAQGLFAENGIQVLVGASSDAPEALVKNYLDGALVTGDNVCDH